VLKELSATWRYKSKLNDIVWPAMPTNRGAAVIAMLHQFEQTQWLPADELRTLQNRQVKLLLEHANRTVPYYREQWKHLGGVPDPSSESWLSVPLLTRTELQEAGQKIISDDIPEEHGRQRVAHTSGSLGMPVTIMNTEVTKFFWDVITMRDHIWHRRDFRRKLSIIRFVPEGKARFPHAAELNGWGCVAGEILETGPAKMINIRTPMEDVKKWLRSENPDYLMTYPSVIDDLLYKSDDVDLGLSALSEIRTISEAVTPEIRQECKDKLGVKLVDLYSAIDVGNIALQCPEHDHYHVQAEDILVEILDEQGVPCRPGETGRVVVTTLHNYATPLIRYEIGDMAVAGEQCPCGRGLPVIKRILGRYRNLLTLPDGKRVWPEFGHRKYVAPVKQIQMVQTGREDIVIRLVMPRKMTRQEEQGMTGVLHELLRYPFNLTFEYVAELRRSDTGKFEEFISLL
jgi:phenylacetate-CoA ligase